MNRIGKIVLGIVVTCSLVLSISNFTEIEAYAVAPDATVNETKKVTDDIGLYAYIPIAEGLVQSVNIVATGGKDYLFLPSCVSNKSVVFHYNAPGLTVTMFKDGKEAALPSDTQVNIANFLAADSGDGSRALTIHISDAAGNMASRDIYVMNSSGLSTVYLNSSDPAQSREFIEASKKNKTKGTMTMLTGNGKLVYAGGLSQIKGRGNTTFGATKKPYQIKLDTAADLAMTGSNANISKTWILLANAYDPTLIHNTVGLRMAKNMGLDAPDILPVDLYYDGNYRGTYLLTEKVELGQGRVQVADLEGKTENANEGKDLSSHATAMGANKYGDIFQYVTGVNNPGNIAGGYLLEQDDAYYKAERSYFITSTGTPFVVKSPENCSKEEMEFISSYVEEMIRAAANGGINPDNGKSVWEYVDKTSLVKYYLLQEITKNADAFSSSTYMYLDVDGMPMTFGPVWDLDDSYGIREDKASVEGFTSGGGYIEIFTNLADFRTEVKKYYNSKGYSLAINAGIDKAVSEIKASQKMNRVLWNGAPQMYQKLDSYENDVAYMKNFASGRANWLKGVYATW